MFDNWLSAMESKFMNAFDVYSADYGGNDHTYGNFRVNAIFCMGCISICTLRLIADDVESAEMVRCNACGGRGLSGYRHGEFG